MKVVSIDRARAEFADTIETSQGETVCLTRHGKPVAMLVGVKRRPELLEQALERELEQKQAEGSEEAG